MARKKASVPIKVYELCSDKDFNDLILNNPALFIDHTLNESIWDSLTEFPKCRYLKSAEEQKARTAKKAEVFTPVHIIKDMIDMLEQNGNKPEIGKTYLEITCGEAPFITTRYHTESGEPIAVPERVGFLDRKLATIKCSNPDEWLQNALLALKDCYGYEFQKDSLSIARLNVLISTVENFRYNFAGENIPESWIKEATDIISWNLFRMDGLTDCIPETDIWAIIKDWKTGQIVTFESCKRHE